jgi:hypothetical protein
MIELRGPSAMSGESGNPNQYALRTTQMAGREHLRITQPDGLDEVLRLPTSSSVVLELPSLESDETSCWQCELNTLLQSCGCGEATAALLINVGALLVVAYTYWNTVKGAPFPSIAIGLGCSVLSIAIGKAVGKLRGRRRLTTSVRRLHTVLMHRASGQGMM